MGDQGTPTAFGTLYARVRPADADAVLVEVLHPGADEGAYDRLAAAQAELQSVQGRHVVRVLEVALSRSEPARPEPTRSEPGEQRCEVVRPGFPYAPLPARLPATDAVRVLADVLLGLADVHDAGLVHGALDERAVLLDTSVPLRPTVRLIGHGLAAPLTGVSASPSDDLRAVGELLARLAPDRPRAADEALAAPRLDARAAADRLRAVRGPVERRRHRSATTPPPTGWVPPPL